MCHEPISSRRRSELEIFHVGIEVTSGEHDGGPTVTVSCSMQADPNDVCPAAQWTLPWPCCEGTITTVQAFVPPGQLTPTHIDVAGACFGCPTNQVTVHVDKIMPGGTTTPLINPANTAVDPLSGSFTARFPIIVSGVVCADQIQVTVTCTTGTCNIAQYRKRLHDFCA
jgi:hypothetical protein